MPGVELLACASSPLVAAWGERWLAAGRLELRFRRPVYDGERLRVELDGEQLTVTGPDGEIRCLGSAGPGAPPLPDLPGYVPVPLPAEPLVDPDPGPLGSVVEQVSAEDGSAYLDAVAEPLPLYRDRRLAHPGLLLRLVNLLLMRNVALGPWVHTSSRCRFLGLAPLPATFTVHGAVTQRWQHRGSDRVRYDALVVADGAPVLHGESTAIYRLGAG